MHTSVHDSRSMSRVYRSIIIGLEFTFRAGWPTIIPSLAAEPVAFPGRHCSSGFQTWWKAGLPDGGSSCHEPVMSVGFPAGLPGDGSNRRPLDAGADYGLCEAVAACVVLVTGSGSQGGVMGPDELPRPHGRPAVCICISSCSSMCYMYVL